MKTLIRAMRWGLMFGSLLVAFSLPAYAGHGHGHGHGDSADPADDDTEGGGFIPPGIERSIEAIQADIDRNMQKQGQPGVDTLQGVIDDRRTKWGIEPPAPPDDGTGTTDGTTDTTDTTDGIVDLALLGG